MIPDISLYLDDAKLVRTGDSFAFIIPKHFVKSGAISKTDRYEVILCAKKKRL